MLVICNWIIALKLFQLWTKLANYQLTQLPNLLNLFVRRVLAATLTKLAELQSSGRRLLVFRRRVISFFALVAL